MNAQTWSSDERRRNSCHGSSKAAAPCRQRTQQKINIEATVTVAQYAPIALMPPITPVPSLLKNNGQTRPMKQFREMIEKLRTPARAESFARKTVRTRTGKGPR